MKSISTMVIEEVTSLAYAEGEKRVKLRSVTDEDIESAFRLPPASVTMEIVMNGERAKWYENHLGEYVTLEIRRRG